MIAGFTRLADMELAAYEDADFALTGTLETDPVVMRELGGPTDPSRLPEVHRRRLGDAWWFKIVPEPSGPPAGTIGIWGEGAGWRDDPRDGMDGAAGVSGSWRRDRSACAADRPRSRRAQVQEHARVPAGHERSVECSVPEVRLLAARRARLRVRRPDAALQPLDAADPT
jgi:hypothetical protein